MICALRNYPYRFIAERKLRINTTGSVVLFKPQKGKQVLHTLPTPITITLYNNKTGEKSHALIAVEKVRMNPNKAANILHSCSTVPRKRIF